MESTICKTGMIQDLSVAIHLAILRNFSKSFVGSLQTSTKMTKKIVKMH